MILDGSDKPIRVSHKRQAAHVGHSQRYRNTAEVRIMGGSLAKEERQLES